MQRLLLLIICKFLSEANPRVMRKSLWALVTSLPSISN